MISEISIKNFKCIQQGRFSLGRLTVFCGVNSGGKSSVLQALLLGTEAWSSRKLNGWLDLMKLSSGLKLYSNEEILNRDADEDIIEIAIQENGKEKAVRFLTEDYSSNELQYDVISNLSTKFSKIWYLGADRSITEHQVRGNRQSLSLGEKCEYLAYILALGHEAKKVPVNQRKNRKDESNLFFAAQVNEWLDFLIPGSYVDGVYTGKDNIISLLFDRRATCHKTNVGFGVSFVLPVLMAGLLAKEGDVLIVENPELHLHPTAQSNFMRFFACMAQCGVQVLLETHSDHIVNGLRKAVVDPACELKADDALIYFFERGGEAQAIRLTGNAELDSWPDEFMDQESKDLYFIRKHKK